MYHCVCVCVKRYPQHGRETCVGSSISMSQNNDPMLTYTSWDKLTHVSILTYEDSQQWEAYTWWFGIFVPVHTEIHSHSAHCLYIWSVGYVCSVFIHQLFSPVCPALIAVEYRLLVEGTFPCPPEHILHGIVEIHRSHHMHHRWPLSAAGIYGSKTDRGVSTVDDWHRLQF